ncbi:MAG: preprotein translocase subunit YajC [Armatimonadetes bacterium]|nr:preprotein translocase subunit YajC [Armatimonadota bacterium]
MEQWLPIIGWWVLIIVLFWWMLIVPQQRQRREREKFLNSLKPGDEVATSDGICGRILNIDENMVTLRIAEGVDIRVLKSGIMRKLTKEEATKLKSVLRKGG